MQMPGAGISAACFCQKGPKKTPTHTDFHMFYRRWDPTLVGAGCTVSIPTIWSQLDNVTSQFCLSYVVTLGQEEADL